MQLIDGRFLLTASDVVNHIECPQRSWLNLQLVQGKMAPLDPQDPQQQMLSRMGNEKEQQYLNELLSQGLPLWDGSQGVSLTERVHLTRLALGRGEPVIYQGTLQQDIWIGTPDFLVRHEGSSKLGPFYYRVEEVKLAHHARVSALVQATFYSLLLEGVQGQAAPITLVLGQHEKIDFPPTFARSYVKLAASRLKHWIKDPTPSYPDPKPACESCTWLDLCEAKRREDDHLWYVANITKSQIKKLQHHGIHTLSALAHTDPSEHIKGMSDDTLKRLIKQARLQWEQRMSGQVIYEILPAHPEHGLHRLPDPQPGDVYFDLEGDPLAEGGPLEYLFGWAEVDDLDKEPSFHALWAHDRPSERHSFETFMDRMMDRLAHYPHMHIYHYAPYEPTALKRLMGRYSTREAEVDHLLAQHILVDLYHIVRHSLMVSQESYSIKYLEPLYMEKREGEITNAGASIIAYDQWKQSRDNTILEDIEAYNQDDCLSTWRLHTWLVAQKHEFIAQNRESIPQNTITDATPPAFERPQDDTHALVAELIKPFDQEPGPEAPEYARFILAHLLNWHRREDKSVWWKFFAHRDMSLEELLEDPESLSGLEFVGIRQDGSDLYRYPLQEHKINVGDKPVDPVTGKTVGEVIDVDPAQGLIAIKTGGKRPQALIPPGPIQTGVLKNALKSLASTVLEQGMDTKGRFFALRTLLMRRRPEIPGCSPDGVLRLPGEEASAAARRCALALDHQYLAIQGPPGSGKSYTASHIIVDLVHAGKTVGITAPSHQVIRHLLDAVLLRAKERGITLKAVQRGRENSGISSSSLQVSNSNDKVFAAFRNGAQVVAGTAWLFARPEWCEALDVLVIDEAGQMSLANALAAAQAAKSLILLGDPQQLRQPSQGHHPPGVDVSVLEYILQGAPTIDPHYGIFLDVTRRMHPVITRYISHIAYDDKLTSHPQCAKQNLQGPRPWSHPGLYYVPIWHEGNRTASEEEVLLTRQVVTELLTSTWTDQQGHMRPLTANDILVVAPYNAQVTRLRAALPKDVRVGTVDKFQGQEAPVVIYSTAASNPEDIPHGLEFLYSLNRLNVAISRAQGVAILIASPSLLFHKPAHIEHLPLINALCVFVEQAEIISGPESSPVPSSIFANAETAI
ncbi:TM0106 family RecB-like putative nuclease [Sulfobacillus thermosulfidooxidans]|uniref:TM0106 family RecB-like putative nuclease n=1 Tax=Sulfobacillus thermosulfidooxidans TaxID=28034 RepID=UPI0004280ED5|nr:TM0106 family RecB-like putative nuclease [Sulfobacillus thermosulfidooxidans]